MKTSKQKAYDLVKKYEELVFCDPHTELPIKSFQIECAKIAVDEIIESGNNIISELIDGYQDLEFNNYWQEVKNELNKMS